MHLPLSLQHSKEMTLSEDVSQMIFSSHNLTLLHHYELRTNPSRIWPFTVTVLCHELFSATRMSASCGQGMAHDSSEDRLDPWAWPMPPCPGDLMDVPIPSEGQLLVSHLQVKYCEVCPAQTWHVPYVE